MKIIIIVIFLTIVLSVFPLAGCDLDEEYGGGCTDAYPLACEKTNKCCPRGYPYYSSRTGKCYESYEACLSAAECHVCSEQ